LRSYPVRVTVVTPCCRQPLESAPVYVAGLFASTTGSNGVAEFRLPVGSYVLTAPGNSTMEETIEINAEDHDGVDAQLTSNGELFLFLQDMSSDETSKDSVMLCASRANIPDDAGRFVGIASLPDSIGPGLRVCDGAKCSDALGEMKITLEDGRRYKPNKELTWFEDFKDECEVAMLFSGTPIRLGDARGARPASAQSDGNFSVTSPSRPATAGRPPKPASSPYLEPTLAASPECWGTPLTKGVGLTLTGRPPLGGKARRRMPTPEHRPLTGGSPPVSRRPNSAGPSGAPQPAGGRQRPNSCSGPRPGSAWRSASGSAGPRSNASSNPSSGRNSPFREGSREDIPQRPGSRERDLRLRYKPLRLSEPRQA